ncbi:GNAT family N-acetyltransferase [Paenibacillus wynnii]|uniref:GCN5 family acetyltransferase n=1 Tax=Paenibacillus wynnii TaxID=268407 RepID=A0A098MAN9_9BACL|nr:GNAT family N-acetyltransferase [Paenibacillus wynnii]KGE19614.1 GCN5 family acetyltransferase [Paenibacillus wynnii]
MIYREMLEQDYSAAYKLWEKTEGMGLSSADSEEEITRYLQRNVGLSQICEDEDGTIAGTALCGHDGRRGYIYHVAVSTSYRGMGVGRALVNRCLNKLREERIAKCHLMVIGDNEGGRGFWSGLGWQFRDGIALYSQDT